MDREVFVDTSYAIALANANDQFHAKAILLARQLRTDQVSSGTVLTGLERVLGITTEDPNPLHEQEEKQIEDVLSRELLTVYTTLTTDKKQCCFI